MSSSSLSSFAIWSLDMAFSLRIQIFAYPGYVWPRHRLWYHQLLVLFAHPLLVYISNNADKLYWPVFVRSTSTTYFSSITCIIIPDCTTTILEFWSIDDSSNCFTRLTIMNLTLASAVTKSSQRVTLKGTESHKRPFLSTCDWNKWFYILDLLVLPQWIFISKSHNSKSGFQQEGCLLSHCTEHFIIQNSHFMSNLSTSEPFTRFVRGSSIVSHPV